MKKIFLKYRKAIGAGVGTFIATFPLVGAIDGSETGDLATIAQQALAAAVVATFTAILPANVDPEA